MEKKPPLPHVQVKDHNSDEYPTFWLIVQRDGHLFCFALDALSWDDADSEVGEQIPKPDMEPVAICCYTHPAYAYPDSARQYAVDRMIEETARALGVPE